MKLIDSNGNIYPSIRNCSKKTGIPNSTLSDNIRLKGYYKNRRKGIKIKEYIEPNKEEIKPNKILQEIEKRYSPEELKLLSEGKGLQDPNLCYPKIILNGEHHKIGVISDGHLGSKYSPLEFHYKAFETFEKENCECILHCGDVVDGLCPRRIATHIHELDYIGFDNQKELAIEVFNKCNLPIYCIAGNHDDWYLNMGGDIVKDICNSVPNMNFLGHNQADMIIGGATIRLFHGGDGSSYAVSYRLQKLVEGFTSGKKPSILLTGHVHKMCYIFDRMIHCVSVPSLQMQTPWMAGKKISAHTGFLIIEFDVTNGNVNNFQFKYYPFYA